MGDLWGGVRGGGVMEKKEMDGERIFLGKVDLGVWGGLGKECGGFVEGVRGGYGLGDSEDMRGGEG